jgi:hypothetical protein
VWPVERTIPGVDASRDELLPYVGPAAALPLFGALARLPHATAVRIWAGLLAAAGAALLLAALALAGTRRVAALFGALAAVVPSGPVLSAFALGQAALIAAAAIACALLALERRARRAASPGTLAAGGAMLLAAIQPNLAIVLAARLRDRAAAIAALLGTAAFAVLTLAEGSGVRGFAEYVHRLGEHGRAERFTAIQHTPAAIAWAFGAPQNAALALGTACALAAVVAAAVTVVRARLSAVDGTLLAIAALPLAVPFFHEHDFAVEALPLCVLAVRAQGAARALAGLALVAIGVDWFGFAQRTNAVPQILLLGFAVACGFVVLGSGARVTRADAAPFAALLALACLAVPLAFAHPAPTWPDALPPGYRAPQTADASAVWAGEQRAAGLETRQPAWGALRALPLAGCVVLGFAIVRCRRS